MAEQNNSFYSFLIHGSKIYGMSASVILGFTVLDIWTCCDIGLSRMRCMLFIRLVNNRSSLGNGFNSNTSSSQARLSSRASENRRGNASSASSFGKGVQRSTSSSSRSFSTTGQQKMPLTQLNRGYVCSHSLTSILLSIVHKIVDRLPVLDCHIILLQASGDILLHMSVEPWTYPN